MMRTPDVAFLRDRLLEDTLLERRQPQATRRGLLGLERARLELPRGHANGRGRALAAFARDLLTRGGRPRA